MPLCPRCHQPLTQVEENDVAAFTCPTCHGTWISAKALDRRTRIETSTSQPHTPLPPLPDLAATVAQSNSTDFLPCPLCKQLMAKIRFLPQIPITLDRCPACDHLWLDPGELGLLLRLYTELLASQPALAAQRQSHLNTLHQSLSPSTPSSSFTSSSSYSGSNFASSLGSVLFSVLLDFLFYSPSHYRNRYW